MIMARHLGRLQQQMCRYLQRIWNSSSYRCFNSDSQYVPRRACLYVPGNDKRKLKKISTLGADCVIMDCEDGVALNRKEEARQTIRRMLDELEFNRSEPIVRFNSIISGLAEEDLDVILKANRVPSTFMVPKVESVEHIDWINDQLSSRLQVKGHSTKVNVIIFIESAMALINLKDICRHGVKLSTETNSLINIDGLVFGSDDFIADIGATRTKGASELTYARQHLVTVAKAFKLQAIDIVYIDYKDVEGLKAQSLEGARIGFTGKQCIHPAQIDIVQEAFTPSREKLEWARELIEAFKQHQQSGKGAFVFRGSMIDMPLLLQAKNILKIFQSTKN